MSAITSDGAFFSNATTARVTDSLGCLASKLHQDQELSSGGMTFYRKHSDNRQASPVFTPASGRGFLVGISMTQEHRRSILKGRHAARHEFEKGALYIRDFSEDYRADLQGPFDFLLFELSPAFLERAGEEERGNRVGGLKTVTAQRDPVLAHLAQALVPALARPREACMLFVEQLGMAIGTYLMQRYGGAASSTAGKSRALSHVHEKRAKQMLLEKVKGNVSIAEIARECNMSASYFVRAFRETTGHTPHHWLLLQRVQRAREFLLHSELPLAEIAIACQFSDQSHFSRVFSQLVGTPPGNWRRNQR
ncbi:AraC family transcriptional regulator [Herbaspirillum lusitanum]|uniref:AraC family transcriptional regulator n=1 Tax=Herbaspirillum lusitanum TaxID=213312 RepID=A0ABW9A5H1_9BURK